MLFTTALSVLAVTGFSIGSPIGQARSEQEIRQFGRLSDPLSHLCKPGQTQGEDGKCGDVELPHVPGMGSGAQRAPMSSDALNDALHGHLNGRAMGDDDSGDDKGNDDAGNDMENDDSGNDDDGNSDSGDSGSGDSGSGDSGSGDSGSGDSDNGDSGSGDSDNGNGDDEVSDKVRDAVCRAYPELCRSSDNGPDFPTVAEFCKMYPGLDACKED